MDTKQHKASILMLPWLAYGHISPFLELSKKLSHKNFLVYFCSTPVNLNPIRENLLGKPFSSIELIHLHLPSLPELPPHYHTTKNLSPHLTSTLKTAFEAAKPAFYDILKTLKPNLVIYDIFPLWSPEVANEHKTEAIMYITFGGASCSFLTHYAINPSKEFPFREFYLPETEVQKITRFMHDVDITNGITNNERLLGCIGRSSNMVLIKTSREIEAKYIDYISQLVGKEIVPVGPLVQEPANKDDDTMIIDWLSNKEPSSVVFVSFGSEYFLSKEEMEEIAHGLELSKVSFIWVVRFHGGEKISIHEALPKGFMERVEERGKVLEGWAPQAKILGHSNTGGFVSHCGWSSTLEGMMFGVPIISMPMHLDQPFNARLVEKIGVGIEVPRENGRLKREEVARVIKEVAVQEEGNEVRRKAKELSERMREKADEEMDVVVEKVMQLVKESRTFAASMQI